GNRDRVANRLAGGVVSRGNEFRRPHRFAIQVVVVGTSRPTGSSAVSGLDSICARRRRRGRGGLLLEGHDPRAASHQPVQQVHRSSVGTFQAVARRKRGSQATRSTVARGSPADETRVCHLKSMKVIVTCGPSYCVCKSRLCKERQCW